jgi:divalent metal cation (Fe/Co/Zn/Cd) transporter
VSAEDRIATVPPAAEATHRAALIRRAFTLEWLTIGWMSVEAAVAVGSGVAAHSLSLIAFGVDSVIELLSAAVLVWRLSVEIKKGEAFSESAERLASKAGAVLLSALALYVVVSAGVSIWRGVGQSFSILGLAVTLIAIPAMYMLSRAKLRLADQLGSHALRADAVESITCGYLSFVVVLGLLAQLTLDAWWVDGITSLAIVGFLVKEAREAWEGDECGA